MVFWYKPAKTLIFVVILVFLQSCSMFKYEKISSNRVLQNPVQTKKAGKLQAKKNSKKAKSLESSKNRYSEKREFVFVPVQNFKLKALGHYGFVGKNENSENGIKISVDKMPLNKFINLVFGKILNVSYYIDRLIQQRKDPITLRMEKPMSKDQFIKTVTFILSGYNVGVREKDGIYYIVPGRLPPKKKLPPFFIGRDIPENLSENEVVGVIVPFYYVNSTQYMSLIKRIVLSNNSFIQNIGNKFLVIIDSANRIREALKFVSLFDRPSFEHKSAILLSLDYLTPKEFIEKLDKLLPYEGIPIAKSPISPGIILIPLTELNSVLVVTPKKSWFRFVIFWKNKLDVISALGDQPRLFVYYPKNRRATDLANIISKLGTSFVSKTITKPTKKSKNVNPAIKVHSEVKVAVDEGRNCIVILATPSQYQQIKNILEKLDTLPKQVLVQITIAEVTLTDNLQYGIEWYLRHSGRYSGTFSTLGTLGMGAGGLNVSIVSDTKKFQSIINAFAKKNLINVLSSPRLVVLDNHEASITVGTQVPTLTSSTTNPTVSQNGTSALVNTIQYRKTGVILHIKPTINSNGILTMQINQEVSTPQTNDLSRIDSPIILDRNISTSVVLKSGSTLLLGGLIKTQKSKTVNKVPLFGDIPILGYLFKTTSKSTVKTELIIEITPYILSNMSEAIQATQRFESILNWFHGEEE